MRSETRRPPAEPACVLVTGASGFIGRRVVHALLDAGYGVRALIRSTSDAADLESWGATLVKGDVRDLESLDSAMAGVASVVHAAADTTGTLEGGEQTTVQGTRNVLDAALRSGVARVVYISSCSVYSYADRQVGEIIDEDSPLEPHAELRGPYSWAKTVTDAEVVRIAETAELDVVLIRPGLVYGPGGDPANPMVGLTVGQHVFLIIGRRGLILPLVHVDDLSAAIVLALDRPEAKGRTFNIVSPEEVPKTEFVERLVRPAFPHRVVVGVPYNVFYVAVALVELLCRLCRVRPPLTRYRLASSQRPVTISSERARRELGWQPVWSFEEATDPEKEPLAAGSVQEESAASPGGPSRPRGV